MYVRDLVFTVNKIIHIIVKQFWKLDYSIVIITTDLTTL